MSKHKNYLEQLREIEVRLYEQKNELEEKIDELNDEIKHLTWVLGERLHSRHVANATFKDLSKALSKVIAYKPIIKKVDENHIIANGFGDYKSVYGEGEREIALTLDVFNECLTKKEFSGILKILPLDNLKGWDNE